VGQGNKSEWSTIYTGYIPINEQSYYNFGLDVSARNVKQLHSKVVYFDEDRKRIGDDYIFYGRDGTFQGAYPTSIVPPLGAKYLRIEILIRPVSTGQTSYLIDNMKLEEVTPSAKSSDNHIDNLQIINSSSVAGSNSASSFFPFGSENHKVIATYNDPDNIDDLFTNGLGGKSYDAAGSNNDDYVILRPLNGPLHRHADIGENYSNKTLMIQNSKPIPVLENSIYNFSISLEGRQAESSLGKPAKVGSQYIDKNPDSIGVIARFTNASDVVENTTKYGRNASGGSVLTLGPESEIYTDLDILKPGNYTIALKTNTCGNCSSFIIVTIQDKDDNSIIRTGTVSIKKVGDHINTKISDAEKISNGNKPYGNDKYNVGELQWSYLNGSTYLDEGKYEIKIYSNSESKIDLDSIVVYSNNEDNKYDFPSIFSADLERHETLDGILNPKVEHMPAYLVEYKKIDPTKYEIKVENATRPYMLSLAETYDPLWMASYSPPGRIYDNGESNHDDDANDSRIPSVPLYSIINGFYINKTGDYTLTIEYEPQRWFIQGAFVSIITTISILIVLIFSHKIHCLTRSIKWSRSRAKVGGKEN
jgi:hypothetical protein